MITIVVVPELGNTIATLGKTLPEKVPVLIRKAEQLVSNHPELVDYIDEVQAQLNWEEILNQLVTFFRIGANSMLSSTISVATGIVSGVGTFFIGLVFACYILLQQEFLKRQMKKLIFAYLKEKHANRFLQICGADVIARFQISDRASLEAVILGMMFFVSMTILRFPFAVLVGVLIAFTALIPIFGAFIGCVVGAFLILTVSPSQAAAFICAVPCVAAD